VTRSRNIPIVALLLALPVGMVGCTAPTVPPPTEAPPTAIPEPTAEPTAATAQSAHWTYEGEEGPEHWGDISADYAACGSGKEQSPIDLAGFGEEDLANITFNYQPSKVNILNNGHTIQVNYDEGSSIDLDGTSYKLAQFHFHAPSEHSVAGKLADAELHLVHKSDDGKLAVVGVLINKGAENAALKDVWAHLPAEKADAMTVDGMVMAADLLPQVQTTYRYAGSLTTPPCSEGVAWNVMTTPIEMSEAQLDAFSAIVEANNRPVQPLGDRSLVEDSTP
jgi:carbonic anhydrase